MQIPFHLCCEIRQTKPEMLQNWVFIQNLQRDRLTTLAMSTSWAENFELEYVVQLEVSSTVWMKANIGNAWKACYPRHLCIGV